MKASPTILAEPVTDCRYANEPVPLTLRLPLNDILEPVRLPVKVMLDPVIRIPVSDAPPPIAILNVPSESVLINCTKLPNLPTLKAELLIRVPTSLEIVRSTTLIDSPTRLATVCADDDTISVPLKLDMVCDEPLTNPTGLFVINGQSAEPLPASKEAI